MKILFHSTLLLALLAPLVFPSRTHAAPAQQFLDATLSSAGKPRERMVFSGTKRALVTYDTQARKLTLVWIWSPASKPLGSYVTSDVALTYRPTAIKVVGPGALCVAGVHDDGTTSIERLQFSAPVTRLLAQPGSPPVYHITPGTSQSAGTIYTGLAAVGPITFLLTSHGQAGYVYFSHFLTSDVYSINTSNGSGLTLRVSGTAFPGNPVYGFGQFLELDHPTMGYLYVLRSFNPDRWFVLVDSQSDGALSTPQELFGDDWVTGGFSGGALLNRTDEFGVGLTAGG